MLRHTVFSIIGVVAIGTLLLGCSEKIGPGTSVSDTGPAVSVTIAVAKIRSEPFVYEAVGTITARTASTLASKLMGTVRQIRVHEGDQVRAGDILLVLDRRQVAAGLARAEAALAGARREEASTGAALSAARAGANLARTTYQRYQQLQKDDSVSQQEFDEVAARHRQAEAALAQAAAMLEAAGNRVQAARAAVDSARVSRKDATIRAPYRGRITARMIDVGDLASPGTPFFTIEKEDGYRAELVLPERHIGSVHLGEPVQVTIPALGGTRLQATVDRIVPAADASSRSFLIKVRLPEVSALRSGMFVRVMVPVSRAKLLLIPASAVIHQGQLTGIYLVDQDQKARFRLIRTGETLGNEVEVLSGLDQGERYVISPPPKLMDGSRLEVAS